MREIKPNLKQKQKIEKNIRSILEIGVFIQQEENKNLNTRN